MEGQHTPERTHMKHVGQLIQQRREAMGLSQAALSREMGGYPSPSLMSRIESGDGDLTPASASKYAEALRLPRDAFMNAAGFATPGQFEDGLTNLTRMLGKDVPVMVSVPVFEADHPSASYGVSRTRELKKPEDVFIVDLTHPDNAPYLGEVLASRARKPVAGQGVIAEVSGKLGAWTYQTTHLENASGEKVTRFKVWGVILRYTTAHDLA